VTHLFVVAGPAASGKSEFARRLATHLGAPWLDLDDDMAELLESGQKLLAEVGMELFLERTRESRYENLVSKAAKLIAKNPSVVISAPFTSELQSQHEWNKRFEAFEKLDASITLFWIDTDPEVRRQRMAERAAVRDQDKTKTYVFTSIAPNVPYVRIDGEANFDQAIANLSFDNV
jgi:predicted kinase